MPKPKHRKNHKKKVAARRKRLADEKRGIEKIQRKFIMDMIKKEQENGAFENTPSINTDGLDGPMIEGPLIDPTEGPSL